MVDKTTSQNKILWSYHCRFLAIEFHSTIRVIALLQTISGLEMSNTGLDILLNSKVKLNLGF